MSKEKFQVTYSIDRDSREWDKVQKETLGYLLINKYPVKEMGMEGMIREGYRRQIYDNDGQKVIHKGELVSVFEEWHTEADWQYMKKNVPLVESVKRIKK